MGLSSENGARSGGLVDVVELYTPPANDRLDFIIEDYNAPDGKNLSFSEGNN